MEPKSDPTMEEWMRAHSKATRILDALRAGEKTRSQLLVVAGGSIQALQTVLQRLVAERRIVRLYPGVYALAAVHGL